MKRKRIEKFSSTFVTLDGRKVRGELMDPAEMPAHGEFIPRRELVTSAGVPLETGDIIRFQGAKLLVSRTNTMTNLWRYALFETNMEISIYRETVDVDITTGMPRSTGLNILVETCPIVVEPLRVETAKGLETPTYQILTGFDAQVGDIFGKWEVRSVQDLNGLRRIEAF